MENYYSGGSCWNVDEIQLPDICGIRPGVDSIEVEWRDSEKHGPYTVFIREISSPHYLMSGMPEMPWRSFRSEGPRAIIDGLKEKCDYAVWIRNNANGLNSLPRIVRTGFVPGTVVTYLHPWDQIYSPGRFLGSPSLVRLPDGALLAGMDVFANDRVYNGAMGMIFRSDDDGANWRFVNRIRPMFHTKLFVHRSSLYLLCTSNECGDLLIGKSEDGGSHWEGPVMLMHGNTYGAYAVPGPQRASLPVVEYRGRLYTSMVVGDHTARFFNPGVLSIDADADLMNPVNWTISPFVPYDETWPDAPQHCPGSIEGNIIEGPDGELYNLMRVQQSAGAIPATGKHILYRVRTDDLSAPLEFVGFVDSPLACSTKFNVQYDAESGHYIMLGNETIYPEKHAHQRTVLAMACSKDLIHWEIRHRIWDYRTYPITEVGLQYPDYIFAGDDLITLVRVSFNGERNEHDSNYITCERVRNFRQYL